MNAWFRCWVFSAALMSSEYGLSEIVKCVNKEGKIEYRDAPCATNSLDVTPKKIKKLSVTQNNTSKKPGPKIGEPPFQGSEISFDFQLVSMRWVFQTLADFPNPARTLVFNAKDKKASINYKKVPWDQVLYELSKLHGYGFTITDTELIIKNR